MARETPAERFGKWLESELAHRKMGKRTLARRMVGKEANHAQLENQRISLIQYAQGKTFPSLRTRKRIARALGLKLSDLPDEDEEDDLSVDGYCLTVTGAPVEKVGMQLAGDLRRDANRSLQRARQIEQSLEPMAALAAARGSNRREKTAGSGESLSLHLAASSADTSTAGPDGERA